MIVRPSYVFSERDILTADKLNLMATPAVELALTDPVNDQNFFRNGNFYSSFWTTPAGVSCPVNVWTTNASYWLCRPQGAAANFLRSIAVPDLYSLFSGEVKGGLSVADVEFGQQINADLSATMRRNVTFSGYIYNGSGLVLSPKLNIYTANAFNNFGALTLQTTVNLQSGANASWTYMTATIDLSTLANVGNGTLFAILLPAGALNDPSKSVLFSRLKVQIGEVATEFVDDPSLFIQAPSVDSTMLQDGCIARPALFQPNVIPAGAYMAKSIKNPDIDDGAIDGRTMAAGVSTTLTTGFTQPAVSATVSIALVSTTGFVSGQPIRIAVGGAYTIASVTDATHLVATNTGASGNAAPATSIPTGGAVNFSSAVVANLGYTPINKAGDTGIGPLSFVNDDVVGTVSVDGAAEVIATSSAQAANDGYMPALAFNRPGTFGRAIGLSVAGRFRTVDRTGQVGYLLDSIFQVATVDVQDKAITLAKLADEVVNLIIPAGIMAFFAGPNPPTGWLICDGSPVNRVGTYAKLFTAIGTTWGSGDNVNTFNVPDLRGRVPIGYVNKPAPGITARTFGLCSGATAGVEAHALSIAELPSHNHGFVDNQHSHGITENAHTHNYTNPLGTQIGIFGGGQMIFYPSGQIADSPSKTNLTISAASSNLTINSQGSNTAHTIMQPFSVAYWIVKY